MCGELGLTLQAPFFFMAAIVVAVLVLCVLPVAEYPSSSTATPSTQSNSKSLPPQSTATSSSLTNTDAAPKTGVFMRTLNTIVDSCQQPEVLAMLLYIATYKAGESMGDAMLKPFLVDSGFTLMEISRWSGVYGMIASISGSLVGGMLVQGTGRTWLLIAAAGNALPQILRALLVLFPHPSPSAVIFIICIEAFSGGALTTRVFTWMMLQVP